MKKYNIFLACILFIEALFAQQTPKIEQLDNQKRRETYLNQFGNDSLKFTILGLKDTLLKAFHSDNGQLYRQEWAADSVYVYDAFGQLRKVFYLKNPTLMEYERQPPNRSYYENGVLKSQYNKTQTGDRILEKFNIDGSLDRRQIWRQLADPSVNYRLEYDGKGRILYAQKTDSSIARRDSFLVDYDTIFHSNGRVLSIKHSKYKQGMGHLADYFLTK